MKILISSEGGGAHQYRRIALAKAFLMSGVDCRVWHLSEKPAGDVFEEYQPDIFYGQLYNLTPHTCELIKERPHLKVVLRAGDYSDFSDEFSKHYPILTTTEKQFGMLCKLREQTGQPQLLQIHYHPDWIPQTHERFIREGFEVISMANFADLTGYCGGQFREEFASDICFIGTAHPYKNKTLVPYLGQFFDPENRYRVKLFGQGLTGPYACGYAPEEICKDLLASATVTPNVHEPHSQAGHFDVIQRPFNLLANKCFCVSDYVEGLERFLPGGVVFGKTPAEFKERVDFFLSNPDKRSPYVENGHREVIRHHTQFERCSLVMDRLGLPQRAQAIKAKGQEVKTQLGLTT